MGVVVKVGGIPRFNVMEQGIKNEGKLLLGLMHGRSVPTADPAEQVRAIDLIARKVDVIGVVPNDAKVLNLYLKACCKEAGIKVVTPRINCRSKNADWDFELLNTQTIGRQSYRKIWRSVWAKKVNTPCLSAVLTVPLVK